VALGVCASLIESSGRTSDGQASLTLVSGNADIAREAVHHIAQERAEAKATLVMTRIRLRTIMPGIVQAGVTKAETARILGMKKQSLDELLKR
jgi:hypothetical protein